MGAAKRLVKAVSGQHYDRLIKMRRSPFLQRSAAWPMVPLVRRRQARNGEMFPFDITGAMGLGGALNHVVRLLAYAESQSLRPIVRMSNPLYASPGRDAMSTLFSTSLPVTTEPLDFHRITNEFDYMAFPPPTISSIGAASEIFARYFVPNQHVRGIADEFLSKSQVQRFGLSVHFRGTDKRLEAAQITYERMLQEFDLALVNRPVAAVFLATDDPSFASKIRARYPRIRFLSFELGHVEAGIPRHFSTLRPEEKAIEAMVNMILLANSALCLRTASFLSAWSKILNPSMRIRTVNRLDNLDAFPENILWIEQGDLSNHLAT